MNKPILLIFGFVLSALTLFTGCGTKSPETLIIYSSRNEQLIKPIFDAYTKETGVKIVYQTGEAPVLIQQLKAEGERSPADIFMTVDAGALWQAKQEGIFQPLTSEILVKNIPSHLRDSDNQWFGFSVRARTIVYHSDRVKPADLSTYQQLAEPVWKNRLLLRTSKKVYTQSLTSMFISELGEDQTETILKGWLANLAASVFNSDEKMMEAMLAGQGDVAIVNSYYYGRILKKNPQTPLKLFWPNQDSFGVHVNISGAGLTKHAPHRDKAVAFLEWLSSPQAQKLFAEVDMEYPANPEAPVDPLVQSWGTFKQNTTPLSKIGELQPKAIQLMDKIGYE